MNKQLAAPVKTLFARILVLTLVTSICSFLPPFVAAQEKLLTSHDVAMIKTITSAEISPDGSLIAYTVSVPRDPLADESGRKLQIVWPKARIPGRDQMPRIVPTKPPLFVVKLLQHHFSSETILEATGILSIPRIARKVGVLAGRQRPAYFHWGHFLSRPD